MWNAAGAAGGVAKGSGRLPLPGCFFTGTSSLPGCGTWQPDRCRGAALAWPLAAGRGMLNGRPHGVGTRSAQCQALPSHEDKPKRMHHDLDRSRIRAAVECAAISSPAIEELGGRATTAAAGRTQSAAMRWSIWPASRRAAPLANGCPRVTRRRWSAGEARPLAADPEKRWRDTTIPPPGGPPHRLQCAARLVARYARNLDAPLALLGPASALGLAAVEERLQFVPLRDRVQQLIEQDTDALVVAQLAADHQIPPAAELHEYR